MGRNGRPMLAHHSLPTVVSQENILLENDDNNSTCSNNMSLILHIEIAGIWEEMGRNGRLEFSPRFSHQR